MRRLPRLLWLATLVYWVLLSVLTHLPLDRYIPEEQKKLLQFLDKPEHFVAYFILTALLGCSLAASYPHRRRLVWLAVPVALALGAIDEWTQTWVNRTCSLNDWFANALGTFAGMIPVLLFGRSLRRRAAGTTPGEANWRQGDPARAPTYDRSHARPDRQPVPPPAAPVLAPDGRVVGGHRDRHPPPARPTAARPRQR